MPRLDHGVYEPGEDVRVFDGAEDDEDVEGSRLPLLIVLALLVLAMFAGVVWLAYTQGVARGRTETPVITAANGPARIAPANPGGAEQPYKGFKIYEQPAPPDEDSLTTPQTSPRAAAPQEAKIPPPPPTKPAIVAPAPAPSAPTPAPKLASAAPAKPAPQAKSLPQAKPAAPQPSAAPIPAGPATAPPRALSAPSGMHSAGAATATSPASADARGGAEGRPVTASGSAVLQIGAYKSQADAEAAWKVYKAKHAALLSGYGYDVQQADLGEKGVWYRLRIAGFASKDVAVAMCDRLKTDGGACILSK